MRLLCISNGHGEDVIAIAILQALQVQAQDQAQALTLAALPMVGAGDLYHKHGIPLVGMAKVLPSGGFLNMDSRQLVRDLKGGLVGLTWAQVRAMRAWLREGGVILAVGDIVPLLFGYWSGARYAFVGTAKSDYYWRDEQGVLPRSGWFGDWRATRQRSDYFVWERWLMLRSRCRCVFARDTMTTLGLKQWPIRAFDAGNPMMDGLDDGVDLGGDRGERSALVDATLADEEAGLAPLTLCLLPGSRVPEVYGNWQILMRAVEDVVQACKGRELIFLAAIASSVEMAILETTLLAQGWQVKVSGHYVKAKATLMLSSQDFVGFLQRSQMAIAMAGTATEQFVGLGKPAITLPGPGPQFTLLFAERQTCLLGPSVTLVQEPGEVGAAVMALLNDPDRLAQIYQNGRHRLGAPGAAQRIAEILLRELIVAH
jgi:uncharacterized protein (TIGR03492 family)